MPLAVLGALAVKALVGAAVGAAFDIGIQLLSGTSLNCLDWGSVASSALLGAIGAGIAAKVAKLRPMLRLAIEAGVDLLASTVIDVAFRGAQFGEAFMRNVVASIGGSVVGEAIGAVGRSRFARRLLDALGGGSQNVGRQVGESGVVRTLRPDGDTGGVSLSKRRTWYADEPDYSKFPDKLPATPDSGITTVIGKM